MSPLVIALTLWLAANLAVVGIAWLRYLSRARSLRVRTAAMIEAAERYANSHARERVPVAPYQR